MRKSAYQGHLAHEVGWKYHAVTATLEEKRKEKAKMHYCKKQLMRLQRQAKKNKGRKSASSQRPSRSKDSWSELQKTIFPKQTNDITCWVGELFL